MSVTDIAVSSGDGAAGVSSGDAALPDFPTVSEIVEDALSPHSPAAEGGVAAAPAGEGTLAESWQLLSSIDSRLEYMSYAYVALLVVVGILCGVELIKGFWLGKR